MELSVADARKLLFTPCKTRGHFQLWLRKFLNLDFPDCTVSEESTTNPLDAAWEYYDRIVRNDLDGLSRVMTYAGRGNYKTLSAAALETMVLLHTERNVGHMAAVDAQSQKSAQYLKEFFEKPLLKDFKVGDNARGVRIVRYVHKNTGAVLTESEFKVLSGSEKLSYVRKSNYMKIVICSLAGSQCVSPQTLVTLADGTLKPAEDLEPGMEIRSFDTGARNWVKTKVAEVGYSFKQSCVLTFEDGSSVTLSEDHPVLCSGGWRRARALKKYHKFWLFDGSVSPVERLDFIHGVEPKGMDPSQVLMGTVLGDASLTWPKSPRGKRYGCGPRLQLFHCTAQLKLLDIVAEALMAFGIRSTITPSHDGAKLTSQVSEKLIPLYLAFGLDRGKKMVTEELLAQIGPDGLAMWFMDDGSGGPEVIGSKKNNRACLATCGFSCMENAMIADWLRKRWGFLSADVEFDLSDGKEYPFIALNIEDSRRFSEIVWDKIIPCCRYKLLEPVGLLDNFCIDSGLHLPYRPDSDNSGFWHAAPAPTKGQRLWRQSLRKFRALFTKKLKSIVPVGPRLMCDVTLDAPPQQRNFVANSLILLHNSEHVEFFCVDEIDVVPPQNIRAYRLAQNIPDPRDGMLPLTLLTSTRKSRVGLVQEEIDNSDKTGLKVHHWNLIDVTESCAPTRHKPQEKKETYYVNDDLVSHISAEEFEVMADGKKAKWYPVEGFAGCRKCRLFPGCKGRLATHQTSKSLMLKPITFGLGKFTENTATPELITTEYLCRKPDTSGLIYPRLDAEVHFKTAAQIADLINGEENSVIKNKNFGKAELIQLLKSKSARFAAGLDWGFVHNFVVTTTAMFGKYVFVLDCFSQAGLELDDKIASSEFIKTIYDNCPIYADPEDPASTKSFRRKGYKTKDWNKFPGSVQAGIECVRSVILNAKGEVRMFFLADDPGVAFLFKQLRNFRKKIDAAGRFTEDPADEGKDEPDSLAYVIMNTVGSKGVLRGDQKFSVTESVMQKVSGVPITTPGQQQWMKDLVAEKIGTAVSTQGSQTKTVKKGRFWFSQ